MCHLVDRLRPSTPWRCRSCSRKACFTATPESSAATCSLASLHPQVPKARINGVEFNLRVLVPCYKEGIDVVEATLRAVQVGGATDGLPRGLAA